MNTGKQFEKDFKESVPAGMFYYRFRDGTSSWGKESDTRFQPANICDCMIYNGKSLFMLELKSINGSSLPFSNIRDNQLKELELSRQKGCIAGFVIFFRQLEECYFLDSYTVKNIIKNSERKSISLIECQQLGKKIPAQRKRINYKFDLVGFLAL